MKKIFLFIQLAALAPALPAFAMVGGPFDNGDYSVLLERGGFYESAYSFQNGSGYSQWTADNLQGNLTSAGGGATVNISQGSLIPATGGSTNNGNRTVLYYKGVTYFGAAMGEVDTEARTIMGFGNANSDFSTSQVTQQQQAGIFTASSSTAFSTNTVVSSGRAYTANVNWTGKITATSPQMRWTGSGELSIIAPNGSEAIASLAYTGYQQLIQAISQSVSQSGAQIGFSGANYTAASASIAAILNGTGGTPATSTITPTYAQALDGSTPQKPVDVNGDGIFNNDLVQNGQTVTNTAAVSGTPSLSSYLNGTGPDNSYDQSTVVKITVSGYRRFF